MKIEIKKIGKLFVFLLIIAFLGLYFAYTNGYDERIKNEKINLTNQMIEAFEKDIQEGKDVTIESYYQQEKDYSTRTSKASLSISSKLENMVDSAIKFIFRKLGSIVE